MTDYFWTDVEQAQQRLGGSVVLYDGQPVYIDRVERHEDGHPRAELRDCASRGETIPRKKLNSPKFKKFRELPNLGWCNPSEGVSKGGALFCARRAVATRTHGISNSSIVVSNISYNENGSLSPQVGNYSFTNLMFNKGWVDAHNNEFPTLDSILNKIQPRTAIAFSRQFAVIRDADGVRWLFRDLQRVGIFTGADTLCLISRYAYLREEIMAEEKFTLNTIREF